MILAVTLVIYINCLYGLGVLGHYRYNYVDDKIYSFAFTGIQPGSYFDGDKLTGVRVELMKEVCCRAGKRCDGALVEFEQCMNRHLLSQVLDNRWHDVCIELSVTLRRSASYAFSNITYFFLNAPAVVVGKDSNITLEDLKDPRNDFVVAHMADPELTTSTSLQRYLREFFVKPENVVPIKVGGPSESTHKIIDLINDPCSGVHVGLVANEILDPNYEFQLLTFLGNPMGNLSMMVRKDSQYILDWWDFTLKRFMCSKDYVKFCRRMDKQFGAHPNNCPHMVDVDCNDCSIPHRVPGCSC